MNYNKKAVEKYSPASLISSLSEHVKNGTITVPEGFNHVAAINSAMYILTELTDKNGKPALEVCTKKSINYALTKMVLLGLNPLQKQGYFIVYGNELQFQPSYFGERALATRAGITDIVAVVVYDGDEFVVQYKDGYPVITHTYYGGEKITHAYCLFTLPNGRRAGEVMTFAQIVKSWARSKDPQQKIHKDQPDEMAKRTVTRRALKPYINSFIGDEDPVIQEEGEAQVIQLDEIPEEKPEEKPEGRPAEKPASQPAAQPAAQPTAQPSARKPNENLEIPF